MFFKLFILFVIFINLGLPLNNELDIIFVFLGICILFFLEKNNLYLILKKKIFLLCILLLTIINFSIPKFLFQEIHQIFLNKNDLNVLSSFIPKELFDDLKNDYDENFNLERALNAGGYSLESFNKQKFINKPYAHSSDSFFQKNNFTRINRTLNFNSREGLRMGEINSGTYNFPFDKHFRRSMPYYVIFEIDEIAKDSKICSNKKIYLLETNYKIDKKKFINHEFEITSNNKCIILNFKNKYSYIFGYSINKNDNLEIKTSYNLKIVTYKFLKYFLTFLILFFLTVTYFNQKKLFDFLIYFVSVISTLILVLIRDPNLLTGLRYYRGGADGLLHYSHGKDILQNLINYDFFLAFRGGEDIFYFMPGLRYFSALNNLIFGETSYGYLILCSFIPFIIFKIFEKLINKKIAIYLLISFIFLPVFENMGFGFFNYIWQFARHHAETASIFLILYSLYLIFFIENNNISGKQTYLIGLLLALSVFLRPNFFPTSLILFFCTIFLLVNKKQYIKISNLLLGYSFIFICLIHNLYFGDSLIFLTKSAVNFKLDIISFFKAIKSFLILDFENKNFLILKSQLYDWNPFYNIHRLVILCFICIFMIIRKHGIIVYSLFISMILQHGLLLLSHPSSCYAYLAWLLTFILFVYNISRIRQK